jgi:plasmid maintenance system antidote protein VapI
MQESIDLLSARVEAQGGSQQQMAIQLQLTSQALAQAVKEQAALAQQMAVTGEVVARLVAGKIQTGY